MIDPEVLGHEPVLRGHHVVVIVVGEARVEAVARLARVTVPDPIREDDVVARGVEQRAGSEQDVRELPRQELAARAAGAVQDEHRVGRVALGVAPEAAQRLVVEPELGQGVAGPEAEVADDEVALARRGRRGRRPGARRGQAGGEHPDQRESASRAHDSLPRGARTRHRRGYRTVIFTGFANWIRPELALPPPAGSTRPPGASTRPSGEAFSVP